MTVKESLSLKSRIVSHARDLGFDMVRVTTADPFPQDAKSAVESIKEGRMDGMPWFTEERVERAADPQKLLPGAKSIIAVAVSYLPREEENHPGNLAGRVARYAQWTDYHAAMKSGLRKLAYALPEMAGAPVRSRVFVDDGSLLERAVVRRAGIGWFGKNSNILTASHGSWVFLGALLTDLSLEPDEPLLKNCGSCVTCIEQCPTGAIVAPYVIDAPRCISYLTIENRGAIPRDLRPLVGDWVFGCDICQEVCPVNRGVTGKSMAGLKRTGFSWIELVPLLSMSQEEFSAGFKDSPIKRAKLAGMQRNACVALGNIGDVRAAPALGEALLEGVPMVRAHAAWALGRIGGGAAERFLEEAALNEQDPAVLEEIEAARRAVCHAEEPVGRRPL